MTKDRTDQPTISKRRRTMINWTLSAIIGLAAGTSYATHGFNTSPLSPIATISICVGIGLLACLILTRFIQPAWQNWSRTVRWSVLGESILCASVIIITSFAFTPARAPTVSWLWDVGPQTGHMATSIEATAWGQVATQVIGLHPTDQPNDANPRYGPWRIKANLSGVYDGTAKRLTFKLTQPEGGITDPRSGQIAEKGSGDGVIIVFKVDRAGTWQTLQQLHLDSINHPDQRHWHTVELDVPADSRQLGIEALPGPLGSTIFYDSVWVSLQRVEPLVGPVPLRSLLSMSDLIPLGFLFLSTIVVVSRSIEKLGQFDSNSDETGKVTDEDEHLDKGRQWFTPRRLFKWYVLASVVIAIVMLPLAISLAPWLYAATTSVQLNLNAPAGTQIDVCWDEAEQECLPLVPYAKPGEGTPTLWLTQVPPQPAYHLAFIFRSPVNGGLLHGLTLQSRSWSTYVLGSTPIGAAYERVSDSTAEWFIPEQVESQYMGGAFSLTGAAGARLRLPQVISAGPVGRPSWANTASVWLLLVGIWLMVGGLGLPLLRQDTDARRAPTMLFANKGSLLWLAFGVATLIHVLLVVTAPAQFGPHDPLNYLTTAQDIVESGIYENSIRLPGYPLLLAMIFRIFGYHLSTVALLQAVMFDGAVMVLALSLRRWLHPLLAVLAIPIAILSPAQVEQSRWMMSDSAFATFAVLSFAALFGHIGSQGRRSNVWLMLYAVLATAAFMFRPNGVVLFAALIPVCVPTVWRSLWRPANVWSRARSIIRYCIPYFLAVLVLAGAILGWSARNYRRYGHFQLSVMESHVALQSVLFPGLLDMRSLLNTNCPPNQAYCALLGPHLYDDFVTIGYEHPELDTTWLIPPTMVKVLAESGWPAVDQFQLGELLKEIGYRAQSMTQWQASLMGALRTTWGMFNWHSNRNEFALSPLDRATLEQRRELLRTSVSSKMIYDDRSESWFTSRYTLFAQNYSWYLPLWIIALMSGLTILWRRQLALAFPLLVYVVNIVLVNIVMFRFVYGRYPLSLDTLLVFQCALGLSVLFHPKLAKKGSPNLEN